MTTPKASLNLTTTPETVSWPETHYVYIEKTGPFQNTAPQAWEELQKVIPQICEHNQVTAYTSLYKAGRQIYRAGVGIAAEPKNLPAGLQYTKFPGGKYARLRPGHADPHRRPLASRRATQPKRSTTVGGRDFRRLPSHSPIVAFSGH